MPDLDRPVFLVGTGRCGSTVLHEMLAHHESLSFLTHTLDRNPDDPQSSARRVGLRDHALLRSMLGWRLEPSEAWKFWETVVPGFSMPCRDLVARDVGPRVQRRVNAALMSAMKPGRDRLLVKFTGWPRVGWVFANFPDALVIHVIRDPRAVSRSLMNVPWWSGWKGPTGWHYGPFLEREQHLWEEAQEDFGALACLEWDRLVRAHHAAVAALPAAQASRCMEVRYDEMCADRDATLARILEHAGLDPSDRFARHASRYGLENRDHKWSVDLSAPTQAAMQTVLEALSWRELYPETPTIGAGGTVTPAPSSSSR